MRSRSRSLLLAALVLPRVAFSSSPTTPPPTPHRGDSPVVVTVEEPPDEVTSRVVAHELGAGQGVSYSFELPAIDDAIDGDDANMAEVTVRTLANKLGKSTRPHVYCLAFALDTTRSLRARPGTTVGAGGGLIDSVRKLRNSTDGGFVFRVPRAKTRSTVHVLVASNYVGAEGGVPIEVEFKCPGKQAVSTLRSPMSTETDPAERRDPPKPGSPLRVLAIDGGGSRGVVPLEVLGELEKLSGVRTRDQFDLFCGTSTGSIIAAGISIADLPIDVCSRLYQDLSSLLFGSRLSAAQRTLRLRAVMSGAFGTRLLDSSGDDPEGVPWPLCEKHFCAIATDMSTMQFRPYVYRSYRPPNLGGAYQHHDHASHKAQVLDALMSSTSAPTYFSNWNATIDGEMRRLMDGGLCANNPTHFALVEAAELFMKQQDALSPSSKAGRAARGALRDGTRDVGLVLSLGCGCPAAAAVRHNNGLFQSSYDMLQGLFNLMTDTDMTHEVVRRMLQAQATKYMDAPSYFRLTPVLDERHLRFDEADEESLRGMRMLTREFLRKDKAAEVAQILEQLEALRPGRSGKAQAEVMSKLELQRAVAENSGGDQKGGWLVAQDARKWAVLMNPDLAAKGKPLRPLRKRVAAATGMSGFFSGKTRGT